MEDDGSFGRGVIMAKTQAEYQREYRQRQKLTPNTNAQETNEILTRVTEPEEYCVTVCKTCGNEVNHHLIDMCLSCVQAKHRVVR